MPICSRCGVDQPDDAFSEESQPLCETCYEWELEEEAAGGEVGNDGPSVSTGNNNEEEEEEEDPQQEQEQEVTNKRRNKKPVTLSNAARLVDADGNLLGNSSTINDEPPDRTLLEPLVNAIEARGYSSGLGLDSRAALEYRLERILFDSDNNNDSVIRWLTKPILQALLYATSETLQVRVAPLNLQTTKIMEPQTLLHWACQWKLLSLQCGWKGHDDIVDLLLRAGADANASLPNGCTPLFFAVKYGTVDTLRLLVEANANPLHKDQLHQTCLRNALPQASPYILQYLLEQCHVPAHETFVVTDSYDNNDGSASTKVRINALDILVTEFTNPEPDVSWATLGMPSVEDYARCILLFLDHGVQLSPHYPDVTYFLGHYLQGSVQARKRLYYTRKVADLIFGQWLPLSIQEQVLVRSSGGGNNDSNHKQETNDHPEVAKDYVMVQTSTKDNDNTQKQNGCPLCRESKTIPTSKNTRLIRLYCGHCFCQDHLDHHVTSVHAATDPRKAVSCPTCIRPLARDVLGDDPPTHDVDSVSVSQQRRLGLLRLTLQQLQFECQARNLEVPQKERQDHCLESLVADWQDFTVPQHYLEAGDDDEGIRMSSRLILETTMSRTMISQDHYLWVAPTQGCVMIPIVVKGVPIMALVSTTSPYTVVSPRFVQTFGFRVHSDLQYTASNPLKFVRTQEEQEEDSDDVFQPDRPIDNKALEEEEATKSRPKPKVITAPQVQLAAVEDFCFTLKGSGDDNKKDDDSSSVEVRLDSVFQISEPNTHSFPVGVVLGLDFFQSAAWTQMTVEVDLEVCLGRTMALMTGGLNNSSNNNNPNLEMELVEPRRADFIEEELRYYSHSGKTVWTPLWHVYVSKYDSCLSLEQYLVKPQPPPKHGEPLPPKEVQVPMTKCAYCCRKFPFVPRGENRTLWEILMSKPKPVGMISCSLCDKDTSNDNPSKTITRTTTYYCDKKCQQKAQLAHSALRHDGMDLSKHLEHPQSNTANWKKNLSVLLTILVVFSSAWFLPEKFSVGSRSSISDIRINPDYVLDQDDEEDVDYNKDNERVKTVPYSASNSPPDGFVREL